MYLVKAFMIFTCYDFIVCNFVDLVHHTEATEYCETAATHNLFRTDTILISAYFFSEHFYLIYSNRSHSLLIRFNFVLVQTRRSITHESKLWLCSKLNAKLTGRICKYE